MSELKTAEEVVTEYNKDISGWYDKDEAIEIAKIYALQVAEAVRDECIKIAPEFAYELYDINLTQFIK